MYISSVQNLKYNTLIYNTKHRTKSGAYEECILLQSILTRLRRSIGLFIIALFLFFCCLLDSAPFCFFLFSSPPPFCFFLFSTFFLDLAHSLQ